MIGGVGGFGTSCHVHRSSSRSSSRELGHKYGRPKPRNRKQSTRPLLRVSFLRFYGHSCYQVFRKEIIVSPLGESPSVFVSPLGESPSVFLVGIPIQANNQESQRAAHNPRPQGTSTNNKARQPRVTLATVPPHSLYTGILIT
jgi:hypothetical protein